MENNHIQLAKHWVKRMIILFMIMVFNVQVSGQCNLSLNDVQYCNNGGAVLGIGMQLQIFGVPSNALITSYSWTGPNSFTSNAENPVLTSPIANGTYTLNVQAPGCAGVSQTMTVNSVGGPCPNAAFTQNQTTICDGGTISFTNQTAGSGNTYYWLFGDGATSTSASPAHTYNVPEGTGSIAFTVTLAVINAAGRMDIEQRVINVQQIPAEPLLNSSQYQLYNNQDYLVQCTSLPTDFIFIDGLLNNPVGWSQSFTINWGDASAIESYSSPLGFISHEYALGLYSLTINMIGPNGCSISNTYNVFVGNTPAVFLGIPGNTEQCTPYTFNFPISNVSNNVEGTTYLVTFSDGGAPQTFQHPPPAFVSHTFTESSCGETSPIFSYPDAFSVKITAQNPCAQNFAVVEPIRISTPPVANFTALPTPVCINNPVTVDNTADPGTNVNSFGCNTNHGMVWSITPAAGWNLTSGTLGSINGQPTNYLNWTTGSDQLSVVFTVPGTYTITQRIRNSCGEDVETRTVCVVPPVTAAFNLDFNDQCAPETITTDNLTTPLNTCALPTYLWTINPFAPLAANIPPYTLTSFEPAWTLNVDTTYVITLAATNACGTTYDDTSFTVVAPPTVNLLPIPPGCAPYIVDPSVTYYDGGGSITLQEWSIDNGPWQTITPSEPVDYLPITFSAGTHTISVRITNECGTAISTRTFIVTSPPQINLTPFSVCSGVPEIINGIIPPVVIGTGAAPYLYEWTGAGITPTNISNPSIVLTNTNIPPLAFVSPISLIVTDILGCADTANVNVTVNPLPTLTATPNAKCIGTPAVPLTVSSDILGTTFDWTPSNSLSASTGSTVQANPSSTTTYTITGTVTSTGCTSTTTTELIVNPLPVVDAQAPIQLCAQAIPTAILQGTPAGGIWSDPTPLTGTLLAPNIYTPSTTPGTDVLTYTYTDANGCTNSDNVQVTILTVDLATVGANFALCENAPAQLLNTGQVAGGIWTGTGVALQSGSYFFNPSIAGPGLHILTYTINGGTSCESSASLTATVYQLPTVNVGLDQTICSGTYATISSSVSLGTPAYQYAWSPSTGVVGATNTNQLQIELLNQTITDVTNTYNLTITDANGCIVSDAVDLTIHPLPIVEAGNDQTVCTQPINYTLSGFSPIINGTGVWTGSAQLNGNIYTPLSSAGVETLYYTFTDLNGCVNLDSMQITNVSPITPNAGSDLALCLNAGSTTILPLTNPGGIWSGPGISSSGVFDPIVAGVGTHTYTYTINSNSTCQADDQLQIIVHPIPTVNAGLDIEICSGLQVNFTAQVNSGTQPYSFTWTPVSGIIGTSITNQIDVSIQNNGLADVVYPFNISVTDANNCIVSDVVNLTVHPLPVVEAGPNQTLCSQVIPYTLTGFSPTINGVGVWSGSTQLVGNIYTPTSTPLLDTITYTFTDLNGCINKDSLIITTLAPIYPNAGIDTSLCLNVGLIALNSVDNPGGIWSGPGINAGGVFDPQIAGVGTHILTYTINSGTTCQTSDTRSITIFPIPNVNAGLDQTICSGDTVVFNASVNGGLAPYSYAWAPIATIIGSNSNNSISVNETNQGPGINNSIYSVQVTDNNQCVVSDIVQLSIRPNPIVIAGPDTSLCFSVSVPYLLNGFSPAGGTWLNFPSNSGTLTGLNFQTGGIGFDTLSYSYTDPFGCSSKDSILIDVTSPLVIDAGPDLRYCEDDAAITLSMPLPANPPANYTAAWTGPGIVNTAGVFSFNPALAGPGNHTINYTFEFGATCAATDAVDVYVGSTPEIVSSDFGICDLLNQNLNVTQTNGTGTSPFVYQWLPNAGLSSTTILSPTFTADNVSGIDEIVTLQLTVNDNVGCSAISTIDITVHPLPVVDAGLNFTLCNQPIAFTLSDYSPTAGGTGVWTGSANLSGNVYTPTGLANGLGNQTLTYTFTDNNGCVNSDQVTLTTIAPVFPNAGLNQEFCFDDASAQLIPITQPGGIWLGPGVSLLAGNYEFDPSAAGVGTHQIVYTIFDGTTCETHDTLIYKVYPMPDVDAGIDQQMCSGDTVSVSGIGSLGTLPYQFNWTPTSGILSGSSTANASIQLFNNTAADVVETYTISLTDSAGCIATDIIDITVHPLPTVDAGVNNTLCNQPIPFTLSGYSPTTGGTGVWTGNNLVGDVYTPNGLGNQTLTYTFTDLNGCVNSDQVTLTTIAPVFPNAGLNQEFCFEDASVALIPITQPGGIWLGPGVSLLAGNYAFDPSAAGVGTHEIIYTIFEGTTCETHDTLIYKVFPMPDVDAGIDQQMCSGDTVSVSGTGALGTLPYQFAWTPITGILSGSSTANASIQLFNNAAADVVESYTLTLTDSAGCIATDIIDITVHPLPVVNAGLNDILCNQPIPFTLSGYSPTTGGTGVWTGINLVGDVYTPNGLGNQTLTYTFTDLNGCVNADQKTVQIVAPVFPDAGLDQEFCISDTAALLVPVNNFGGIWSGSGIIQTIAPYYFDPILSDTGQFTLFYTIQPNTTCETQDSIQVTVHELPEVKLGPNLGFCIDDACFQLTDFIPTDGTGGVPSTGLFYSSGIISNEGLFCPVQNLPGDQTVYYQYTDPTTTCMNMDSMIIQVHPTPIPLFTVDSLVCINSFFQPTNNSLGDTIYGGGLTYEWTVFNYLNQEYALYYGPSPQMIIADTGTYVIHLSLETQYGCVSEINQLVTIIDLPNPGFSLSSYTGCAPILVGIINTSTGIDLSYDWQVNGIYANSSELPDSILFPSPILGDTTYTVSLSVSNQCGITQLNTDFLARPTPVSVQFADTYSGCSPFVPVFTNASYGSPSSYEWVFSDGFISNDTVPESHAFIAINNDTTIYTVMLIAENACGVDTSEIEVIALPNTVVSFFNTLPQFGCAPLNVQFLNFSSGANSYTWNFDDGSPLVNTYSANHIFEEGGIYNVSMIATDGCSIDTAFATVTVFPKPNIQFQLAEDVICEGNAISVSNSSDGAAAYLWNFGNGATSTSIEPSYIYSQQGNYTIQLIGYSPVFGCPDTLSLPIQVQAKPEINIAIDPMMGCMPLFVTFTNSTTFATSMEWDFGNGQTSTQFSTSTNYYQFGDYNVQAIAHNYSFASNLDCPVDTNIVISVFPKPESSFNLSSNASCGDSVSVSVDNLSNGATSYLWTWQQSNSFEFEPLVTLVDTGIFPVQLVVSNAFACADTAVQSYRLTGQPTPLFDANPAIGCMPLNADFSSLSAYGDYWEWNFGDGNTSTQGPVAQHEYLQAGNYTVSLRVANDNTCFADTTINQMVIVHPRAVAQFETDKTVITADYPLVIFENQSSNATIYDLYPGDGSQYDGFINQHIYRDLSLEEFQIILIANNQFNCPDTAYKTLKVEPARTMYIPNSFTPNGDGRNDLFGPEIMGNPISYNFIVFDRWGHIIFETFDKNVKWDGTFKNQDKEPIKQDVYGYQIQIQFEKSVPLEKIFGRVTIIY
jgi:gliding motility-associated-like protein